MFVCVHTRACVREREIACVYVCLLTCDCFVICGVVQCT